MFEAAIRTGARARIAGPAIVSRVAAAAVAVMVAATLADEVGGHRPAGYLAAGALVLFFLLELPRMPFKGWAMFLVALGVALITVGILDDPIGPLLEGMHRATFYASFYVALGFLRDAAENSPLIKRCGQHLIAQPPGRRYLALATGGHFFGLFLNFGAINLVGAMIKRGNTLAAAGGDEAVRSLRERRMMVALFRGFCSTAYWSPLSYMVVVVLYYFDTISWGEIVPVGVAFAAVAFLTGWAMDRLSRARRATGGGVLPPTSERWTVHLKLAALVVLILGAALAVERLFETRLFLAVTLTVPVVAVAWTVAQHRRFGPRRAVVLAERRVRRMAVALFPSYRVEFVMLAGAGFAGTMVAAAISPEMVIGTFAAFRTAPVLIAVLVVWAFMLMGLVGLNPLVSGTITGSALGDPAAFGLEPLVMAAAMAAGWGVTASFSPFTSPAWGISRFTGKDAWTVTLGWNGAYNLVMAVLLSFGLVLLDGIIGG